jgi:hypothetical protein
VREKAERGAGSGSCWHPVSRKSVVTPPVLLLAAVVGAGMAIPGAPPHPHHVTKHAVKMKIKIHMHVILAKADTPLR